MKKNTFRRTLHEIMEPYEGRPDSSKLSLFVDIVVLLCIVASCALLPLEWYLPQYAELFAMLEIGFTVLFCCEYLVRWYASSNRLIYPLTAYALLDLVAILPSLFLFASELLLLRMFRGIRILRLLRLIRLVRLLRLLRWGGLILRGIIRARIWLAAFGHKYNVTGLIRLFAGTMIAWFVGANLLHITETRLIGSQGFFANYWESYWNMIIVLISGIEDKEPISWLGRIEITVMMIAGIVIIGMLTGEIVSMLMDRVRRVGLVTQVPPKALFKHHILILGMNDRIDNVIRQVTAALKSLHYILVVHPNADQLKVTDSKAYRQVFALNGDPTDKRILDKAGIDDASRIIVLSSNERSDEDNGRDLTDNHTLMTTIAAAMRGQAEKIPTVVELVDEGNLRFCSGLPNVEFMIGQQFSEQFLSQGILNHGVTKLYDELSNFTGETNEIYWVKVPPELVDKDFQAAQLHFFDIDEEPIVPIGIDRSPKDQPGTLFWLCPTNKQTCTMEEQVLRVDDRLLVLAYERPSFVVDGYDETWDISFLPRM